MRSRRERIKQIVFILDPLGKSGDKQKTQRDEIGRITGIHRENK